MICAAAICMVAGLMLFAAVADFWGKIKNYHRGTHDKEEANRLRKLVDELEAQTGMNTNDRIVALETELAEAKATIEVLNARTEYR